MAEAILKLRSAFCCVCIQGGSAASSASVQDELSLAALGAPEKAADKFELQAKPRGLASKEEEQDEEEETTLCESACSGDTSEESNGQATIVQEAPSAVLSEEANEDVFADAAINADMSATEYDLDALAKSAPHVRPDFTGEWLMVRVDGNMDAFMKDSGVSYLMRSAASAARFGVGTFKTQVTLSDNVLHVVSALIPGKVYKSSLRIDGTQQDDKDPSDGKRMLVTPRWEEDGVTINCDYRRANGAPLSTARRYLVGGEMCIEQTSPSGLTVKRYFERR